MDLSELDLFLFDMAGTTVRDDGVVLAAFREVADGAALDVDDEWLRARMGVHKQQVFEEALEAKGRPRSEGAALAAQFATVIEQGLDERPPQPLGGALDAFNTLRGAGVKVGFTTGFAAATAESILGRLKWKADVVVASDEVAHGRPAPDLILEGMRRLGLSDPTRVGACGDTPADLEAATAAACRFVAGVGHGTHTLEELAAAPHTVLLADLTNLADSIRAAT